MEDLNPPFRPKLAKRCASPLAQHVAQPTRPFRVIELITLLVIAGLIIADTLPRSTKNANQPPPASTSATQ